MTGVTHSRALGADAPRPYGPPDRPRQTSLFDMPRRQGKTAALHAKLLKERSIYIEGLKRDRIKRADRALWQKKVRDLTLELLRIEARWTR